MSEPTLEDDFKVWLLNIAENFAKSIDRSIEQVEIDIEFFDSLTSERAKQMVAPFSLHVKVLHKALVGAKVGFATALISNGLVNLQAILKEEAEDTNE